MKVVFFHRKPRPNAYFSIENLFSFIRRALPAEVNWKVKELSRYSEGILNRLYISFEAALNQSQVNHITGDIHFIAIFLRKKRTILTIHDVGFMEHSNRLGRWLLRIFWIYLPVHRSSIITTVSMATKIELLKFVKINPARIRVIYVPIDPGFVKVVQPFNSDCPVILQIGTKANKNVPRLIQALKGIKCKLRIIGLLDAALLNELNKSQIDYESRAGLTNEEIIQAYRDADIVSFVSTYEGFGMPIVEANATGRPIVTSNILSMHEIASDAACLVDPFSVEDIRWGMLKVINDPGYREALISNGFENCRRFDVNLIAEQYVDAYRAVLSH